MRKILSLCMVALMSLLYASQASAVDWVEMQLDTEYHTPGYYQPFYGKYTATEDMDIKASYGVNALECYLDEAMTQLAGMSWNGTYPATYNLKATAGTTYYFVVGSMNGDPAYTLKIEGQKPFGIEWISPAEGEALTTVTGNNLQVKFNAVPQTIAYARIGIKSKFSTTNWNATKQTGSIKCVTSLAGTTLEINYAAALQQLFDEGDLKAGDELQVCIRLQDNNGVYWTGNGGGVHNMYFVAGGTQAQLVSEKIPSKIFSWMEPDNEDGKLVLEFDNNLSTKMDPWNIRFAYGNPDSPDLDNEYTEVQLPSKVDGNKLIVDFTGVSRKRLELLPNSKEKYDTFTVGIRAIQDENGVFVKSPGEGTVGSFTYVIPYEELEPLDIAHEFIPESGSSLAGKETLNIWVNNADKFTYDGVKFEFRNEDGERQTIVVPVSEIKNNSASDDELDLDVTIPEDVLNGTDITVTLNNVKTQDGFDHSEDVMARYDAFMILTVDPEAGSELEKLAKGSFVTITENFSAQYPKLYLKYRVIDNNASDADQAVLLDSWMNKQEDGSWNFEVFYDVDFFIGHTYTLEVRAYENEESSRGNQWSEPDPISSDKIKWVGVAEPFRFSTFLFDGITPSTDTKLVTTKMNKFTLKFDGLVNLPQDECYILMGRGMHGSFESLVAVDPNEDGLSSTWVATVAESFMETLADYLNMSFKAYDIDGRVVEGNMGEEKYSYFYFQYEVAYNVPEFGMEPADGSEVEEIKEFRLTFAEGICPSYVSLEKMCLMKGTETVYNFTEQDFSYEIGKNEKGDEINVAMIVTLPNPVTAPGEYTFIVPEKYLNLGQEEATRFSAEQRLTLTILAPPFVPEYTTTPVAEGKIDHFTTGTLTLTFSNVTSLAYGTGVATSTHKCKLIIDGEETAILWRPTFAKFQIGLQVPAGYFGTSTDKTNTPAGKYEFVIPAGYLTINNAVYNEEIRLTFYVGMEPEGPADEDPLDSFLITEPSHKEAQSKISDITLRWHKESLVSIDKTKSNPTLTIGNARSVNVLPHADYHPTDMNAVTQSLGKEYSNVGNYTINYPEGYFLLGDSETPEKAFSMTYAIGTVGVNNIFGDSKEVYNVYDFQGVQILKNGDVNAVKALPSGFYIINGKKYVFSK